MRVVRIQQSQLGTVRVAAHAVAIADGRVLLVHQASPGPAQGKWTLPGGAVEFGEPAATAVQREVAEETQLSVVVGDLLGVHQSVHRREDGGQRHDVRLLYAAIITGDPGDDPSGEIDQSGWFDLDQLPEPATEWVAEGVRLALAGRPMGVRAAGLADEELLHRLVHRAWRWDRDHDEAAYLAHRAAGEPDSYVDGFGTQPGDLGVVAEQDGHPIGAAWARLFTAATAREGFIDEHTPELVIALDPDHVGRGLGGRLLESLVLMAGAAGHPALSLHVHTANTRAHRLYERTGFTVHHEDLRDGRHRGAVMRLALDGPI